MEKFIKVANYIDYSYFNMNGDIVPNIPKKKQITTPDKAAVTEEYFTDREFKKHRGFVTLTFPNGRKRTIRTW